MTYRIDLPYQLPPLSLNQRLHHRVSAKLNKDVRAFVAQAAADFPEMLHAIVELHYVPKDARRRDEDNLVATLKPACDGLVDAGVVDDDTRLYMTKVMPIIDPPDRGLRLSRLYLLVTEEAVA
jgi:Holliday junction resolvase RusA-like endonuclease